MPGVDPTAAYCDTRTEIPSYIKQTILSLPAYAHRSHKTAQPGINTNSNQEKETHKHKKEKNNPRHRKKKSCPDKKRGVINNYDNTTATKQHYDSIYMYAIYRATMLAVAVIYYI